MDDKIQKRYTGQKSLKDQKDQTKRKNHKTPKDDYKVQENTQTDKQPEKPIVRRAHIIGSKLCLIRRTPDESLDVYYKRVVYIGKKLNDVENPNISELATNSIIWRNHNILGMNYPSTVLKRL